LRNNEARAVRWCDAVLLRLFEEGRCHGQKFGTLPPFVNVKVPV